jgi:hypothetical protein
MPAAKLALLHQQFMARVALEKVLSLTRHQNLFEILRYIFAAISNDLLFS